MNSTVCVIEANPDVTGVGIRASIYALCLGGTVVSYLLRVLSPGEDEAEFSRGVSSALGMQGLALLCTAIYQTFRTELTLFHAICVVHLLALLGMDIISKGRYAGFGPWRLWFFAVIQIIALAAFIAFNVYLWVTAPQFGAQPTCNPDTVYVVFGVSIKATSPVFRYIILGSLGSIAAGFVLVFTYAEEHERLHGQALRNYTLNRLAYFGLCIYLIVSLEQTIQRNNLDPEERGWTFGQVIAIFLLLGVANELFNVVLAKWDRKLAGEQEGSQELVQHRPPSSGNSANSVPRLVV
ncbi:uncharacterized protein N7443_002505 [Penicillium atrosanguineum]|uniref:uncharacterized protein n=1 Tax=Penicillium atrosanguineum TaxID=1132637 RepID=UPI002389C48E|nr:uncharacterized protein N7443_002505 [Penicillium atrosanguineum]KAJ5310044.1 hypothetical protein N7443_002505 [Penicillium atrosanguineum]